jgi:hypothetical protein
VKVRRISDLNLQQATDPCATGAFDYTFLRRERDQLFPDEAFDDPFEERASLSSPVAVAVVMVFQRLERLSSREVSVATKRMVRPASPTSEIANRGRRVKHQSPRR